MDTNNIINYVAGNKETVAFFGKGPKSHDQPVVLYVANTYDGRPEKLSPKVVSTRNIQLTNGRYNISYYIAHETQGIYTAIDFERTYKRSYIVKYVYGFEDEGFTYFVTIQKEDTTAYSKYITRLVRVCQNDLRYYSYTEITLSCREDYLSTVFYSLAQSAFYGEIGKEYADVTSGLSAGDKILYVAFGQPSSERSSTPDRIKGSGVCMYSLKDIRTKFKNAQMDCYRGFGTQLKWIHGAAHKCERAVIVLHFTFN